MKLPVFYTGPDIWLEYSQYSIGGMGTPGGVEKVRAIFERAVTAVGLHMTKGQMVWEAYREFENAVLSTVQVCFFMYLFTYFKFYQWSDIQYALCHCCLMSMPGRHFILIN